jgi:hypothetical protein
MRNSRAEQYDRRRCGFLAQFQSLQRNEIDNKWMVTHEHVSAPFDPKSGHASLDLKP